MPATRYFRFWRQAEDADESEVVVVRLIPESWDCSVCGAENADEFCGTCSSRHGEYVCDCGHKNPRDAKRCEECGARRDDG